jgi:hypothetical protein
MQLNALGSLNNQFFIEHGILPVPEISDYSRRLDPEEARLK